jgi:hypothetical protein
MHSVATYLEFLKRLTHVVSALPRTTSATDWEDAELAIAVADLGEMAEERLKQAERAEPRDEQHKLPLPNVTSESMERCTERLIECGLASRYVVDGQSGYGRIEWTESGRAFRDAIHRYFGVPAVPATGVSARQMTLLVSFILSTERGDAA